MEAASRSESVEACTGRNFNGTFMIIRRAERRSGAGMVFLLDPGGHQVEIREGTRSVLRIGAGRVKHYFIFRTMLLGDKCRRSSTKRGEGLWEYGAGFFSRGWCVPPEAHRGLVFVPRGARGVQKKGGKTSCGGGVWGISEGR